MSLTLLPVLLKRLLSMTLTFLFNSLSLVFLTTIFLRHRLFFLDQQEQVSTFNLSTLLFKLFKALGALFH